MNICPYCKEEINEQATKCRYCLSSFSSTSDRQDIAVAKVTKRERVIYSFDRDILRTVKFAAVIGAVLFAFGVLVYLYGFSSAPGTMGADRTVYVVDGGLLRFAKFAAAVLALFVTIGIFLYGFNLKEVAKETRQLADGMRDLEYQARTVVDDIRKAKDTINTDLAESQKLVKEAQESIAPVRADLAKLKEEVAENRNRFELALAEFQTKGEETIKNLNSYAKRLSPAKRAAAKQSGATHEKFFTVPKLVEAYNFPAGLDGRGECVGLIELGGGYRKSDLETYFTNLSLAVPKVTWESVNGAKNRPSKAAIDAQVTMGIEIIGAIAPGAHIVSYFAPNTDEGFLHAVKQAVNDDVNRPSVISITWGGPEKNWTPKQMAEFDDVFQAAAARGITVVCAAGDSGVTDGMADGEKHVDFPASSPSVLACGATRLTVRPDGLLDEGVWSAEDYGTGGGVSEVFPLPEWQADVDFRLSAEDHRGRGVPDVVANGSPETGYSLYVQGQATVLGGSGAAACLWAGLIALLNQGLQRRIGYINPILYKTLGPQEVLRKVAEQGNRKRGVAGSSVHAGWAPLTGWGSPDGAKLLNALRFAEDSGSAASAQAHAAVRQTEANL